MTPQPPVVWETLAGYWQLDPGDAKALWRALYQARWSLASSLRQAVLHFQPPQTLAGVDGVMAFVDQVTAPAKVVQVVDELRREQQLTRDSAGRIAEHILRRVDRDGRWQ